MGILNRIRPYYSADGVGSLVVAEWTRADKGITLGVSMAVRWRLHGTACYNIVTAMKPARRSYGTPTMPATVLAPVDWIQTLGDLRLPHKTDMRLQELMERNNDGLLSDQERAELESLVDLSHELSLVRATALHLLGRRPG